MHPIFPQVIRPIGDVDGIIYRAAVYDDGSVDYWFDFQDLLFEDELPTIPDERRAA